MMKDIDLSFFKILLQDDLKNAEIPWEENLFCKILMPVRDPAEYEKYHRELYEAVEKYRILSRLGARPADQ